MHLTLSSEVEDELVAILTHACVGEYSFSSSVLVTMHQHDLIRFSLHLRSFRADYMTSSPSSPSMVPYNKDECESYLRHVRNLPDSDRAEGYKNSVIARLWSEIDGYFLVNLYGGKTPLPSRVPAGPPGLVGWTKEWMSFGASGGYERILGMMWFDRIRYTGDWRKFTRHMVGWCKMHAYWVSAMNFGMP
jgi:hypothetical protein